MISEYESEEGRKLNEITQKTLFAKLLNKVKKMNRFEYFRAQSAYMVTKTNFIQ
jgi:hypothetical protein